MQIPFWSRWWRIFSDFVCRLFFPRLILDPSNAISKAVAGAEQGRGLLIVYTHFSFRDAMEVHRSIIFRNPVLRKLYAINPLSYHQYNAGMEWIAKSYSWTFYPVVNKSTLQKAKYRHLRKDKGLKEFVAEGAKLLRRGGVVSIAVNASRNERLDMNDPQKPVGYFIASLQAMKVMNVGVMFVSVSIKGATSYAKKDVGGMNIGKTAAIKVVRYVELTDLLKMDEVEGRVSAVDGYIRSELAKVSPSEYL